MSFRLDIFSLNELSDPIFWVLVGRLFHKRMADGKKEYKCMSVLDLGTRYPLQALLVLLVLFFMRSSVGM